METIKTWTVRDMDRMLEKHQLFDEDSVESVMEYVRFLDWVLRHPAPDRMKIWQAAHWIFQETEGARPSETQIEIWIKEEVIHEIQREDQSDRPGKKERALVRR